MAACLATTTFARDCCAAAVAIGSKLFSWPSAEFPKSIDEVTFVYGSTHSPVPPMVIALAKFLEESDVSRRKVLRKVSFNFLTSFNFEVLRPVT